MNYKGRRAKATDIPKSVKQKVYERDGRRCIFCGAPGAPNAHYISRAQGGLGIEQNIVTACVRCHEAMDNGKSGKEYREAARHYLERIYGALDERKMIYTKGGKNEYE